VPFLKFRLDRVLDGANLSSAEGRARAAERAMDVLAEHPSELVRDQYIQELVGRLGLSQDLLRARVRDLAKNPRKREDEREVANEPPPMRRAPSSRSRPGMEALRIVVHGPSVVRERFVAPYFLDEVQRDIFEGLAGGVKASDLIAEFERRGEEEHALLLSELVVEELESTYDVTGVVAQLLRAAVRAERKSLNRDMLEGRIAPDVAKTIDRDVEERVQLLETSQGESAEHDLRTWLVERASLPSS
jgi:DNA primase